MDFGDHVAYGMRIAAVLLAGLAGASMVLLVAGVYLSKTRLFRRIALLTVQATQQGYSACTYSPTLVGQRGIAQTPLRPAGRVTIQGVHYDAKTPGTYVAVGVAVVVTSVAGSSLTVQAVDQA